MGYSSRRITQKRFARIERIGVSSGFRNSAGNLVGSIVISSTTQPDDGTSYSVDYNFTAPKEGERITVKYNRNKYFTLLKFYNIKYNVTMKDELLLSLAKDNNNSSFMVTLYLIL